MEISTPLVTICIPTFNRANTFLPAALSAASNQTYQNLEILVADNASTDNTPELVGSFGDPRIRYHRQEKNIGSVENINFCIKNSRGIYTLLLMDDDSIDPDFIACCMDAAIGNPEPGLVRTGARIVDDDGRVIYSARNLVGGLDFTQFVVAWTEGKTLPFMCSTLFRTRPLQEIGINSRYHHWDDVISEFQIAFRYGRIDIPDIKASYRIHRGGLTYKEGVREWCEDSRELIELVCRLAPEDDSLLRSRLTSYLSLLNYRIAARVKKRWPKRLYEAVIVYRVLGVLPKVEFFRDFLLEMLWFSTLRSVKAKLCQIRLYPNYRDWEG
jgi:glycosyltransferase involved in cell wall biosynthesis